MGHFKTDIVIFIGLLILASIVLLLTAGQSAIDIQVHDTYFVPDKISLTVLTIGPLTFLIFLARGLTRKFRTKGANIGLIIGLMLIALITYQVVRLQESYLTEIIDEELPGRGQFITETQNRINRTWGLFSLWAIGLFVLILRTIKIWEKGQSG